MKKIHRMEKTSMEAVKKRSRKLIEWIQDNPEKRDTLCLHQPPLTC